MASTEDSTKKIQVRPTKNVCVLQLHNMICTIVVAKLNRVIRELNDTLQPHSIRKPLHERARQTDDEGDNK